MAKKKKQEEEEELEELDEFETQEIESVYPTITPEKDSADDQEIEEYMEETTEELLEEELDEELEIGIPKEEKDYKYLNLEIRHGKGENEFEIDIEGQSHGFLNVFVKELLNHEGVKIAAYKITRIETPRIYLKLEEGYKVKKILRDAITNLREEVQEIKKLFKPLM
jgi:DNA-directed RNA polymerase subunit L